MCCNRWVRHSEIAGGLEVPCCITFKAQPQTIARLQTLYFVVKIWALKADLVQSFFLKKIDGWAVCEHGR